MNLQRVAVVFDNRPRPETTGTYLLRAIQSLLPQTVHLLPDQLSTLSPKSFDGYLWVDDGLSWTWPQGVGPVAWWAIDTHLDFPRAWQHSQSADAVFAAQKDGAEHLRQKGLAGARWLPLACDPEIHVATGEAWEWDWGFVGNLFPGPRTQLLECLIRRFPQGFAGRAYFQEMASIYSRCRIAFNRSLKNDINMRVFESLACGPLLVTNDLQANGQEELFVTGKHLITYESADEMIDQVTYYLKHEDQRLQMARAGRSLVLAEHTYVHRAKILLQRLENLMSRSVVPQPETISSTPRLQETSFSKGTEYFEHARPEVLALIPLDANTILDVGCGSGRLGESLKQRQICAVWGLERDPQAASLARQRLDHLLNVDLEHSQFELPTQFFDVIVAADVLEHLRDPERLLRKLTGALRPGGHLILSLPNLQNHVVIRNLLDGHFTYESAGLLDEDHVRFFTRNEIEKLLLRTGFNVETTQAVPGPGWAEWEKQGSKGEVQVGGLRISGLTREQAADFFTYQFLFRAQLRRHNPALTSVILVTWNQLAYTRLCLDSLRLRTFEPIEIIVVDNASTDGTLEYLRSQPEIRLIENTENRGFPAAVNQGMAIARGQQLLLLNNDTIVTTGWLTRMLEVLNTDPQVGLVGPVSNCVSGPQQVPVSYDDLSAIDGFAWNWGKQHHQERYSLERLVGFCLLIRRETYEALGGLDERFGIGNFEDDDYCVRARTAGYKVIVAVDSFVHHFGHRSFLASELDFRVLLEENRLKFEEKWAPQANRTMAPQTLPPPRIGGLKAIVVPEGGLELQETRPKISLCMIVRDNETTIGPCLESIRPWVDEIIVVDTGSHDSTPQICKSLGAQVYFWPWQDSFSAARNESLRYATGEWIFWMDSDDTIPESCGQALQQLVRQPIPLQTLGFVMQVHCPGPSHDGGRNVTVVDHIKLFRNRPELRFEFRIHEQILPAIRRVGGEVQFTDIYVIHSGSDHSEAGKARKLIRDFALLEKDLQERREHPFVLFNLGMTCCDCGRHREAVDYLTRCLAVSTPAESHVRKAYAILLSSLYALSQHHEGNTIAQRALQLFPNDKELLFRAAMLAHIRGEFTEAESHYLKILNTKRDVDFSSVDADLSGYKALHNLAIVYMDSNHPEKALKAWNQILSQHPDYLPAQSGISEVMNILNVNG